MADRFMVYCTIITGIIKVKSCFSLYQFFSIKNCQIRNHEKKVALFLLVLCICKSICLFHIQEHKYFFSVHVLENKYLSWAINAPHCLIRNKPHYILLDHIKQCNDNITFLFNCNELLWTFVKVITWPHLWTRMPWTYSQD